MNSEEVAALSEAESCSACGAQKMRNTTFCGGCMSKIPGRMKLDLWLPRSDPRYLRAVEQAARALKVLLAAPLPEGSE